jgi:dethiobiotin synthetase
MGQLNLPPGLLVTATDTGVGKTYVTAGIAAALTASGRQVGLIKPVATGAVANAFPRGEDAAILAASLGTAVSLDRITPIVYVEPLAPPVAARRAGRPLTWDELWRATVEALSWWVSPEQSTDLLLVEGVGGVLCPIADDATVADLAVALDFPTILVARPGLGTVNHTLLSVQVLRGRGVRVAGIVLNDAEGTADPEDPAIQTNPMELARWLPVDVPVLASVVHSSRSGADRLSHRLGTIDWMELAACPRRRIEQPGPPSQAAGAVSG